MSTQIREERRPSVPQAEHLRPQLKKSFVEALGSSQSQIQPEQKIIGRYKGFPAVSFTSEEVISLSAPYQFALVGRFTKSRPPLQVIRRSFEKIGFKPGHTIGLLAPSLVLINFQCPLDYQRCFSKKIWNINGGELVVSKWSPNFHADLENPVFPIWVSLVHLPIHLQEAKALHCIARSIGNPLMMDASTTTKTRPSVARFCVEIDVSKELPKKIWIDNGGMGFFQDISYENVPDYCCQCRKSGHLTGNCFKNEDASPEQSNDKQMGVLTFVQKEPVLPTPPVLPTCEAGPNFQPGPPVQSCLDICVGKLIPVQQDSLASDSLGPIGTPNSIVNADDPLRRKDHRAVGILDHASDPQEHVVDPTSVQSDQVASDEGPGALQHVVVRQDETKEGCSTPITVIEDGMTKTQEVVNSIEPEMETTTKYTFKETIVEVDGHLFLINVKEPVEFQETTETLADAKVDTSPTGSTNDKLLERTSNNPDSIEDSLDQEKTENQSEPDFESEEYQYEEGFTLVKRKKGNYPELTIQTRSGYRPQCGRGRGRRGRGRN
ncbi:unnamed protein product [Cuscuta campestris]|uniref:DUF4283 domain-containing protein n=1 Tax=Cuscuta campestris TaxID=132261 RepID=A0A484LLN2_9ASTE|nr:unnamed protein product [Cuscuta campestris]